MKLIWIFLFLFVSCSTFAQPQKGDWLVRGNASTVVDNSLFVRSSTNIQLDIALGYFINQQWMLGGGVGLQLTDFSSSVENEIFGRFYFKDSLSKRRFYLETRLEARQFSPIGAGQSNRRFKLNSGILGLGCDYFLSPQLAIEGQIDYYFLNHFRRFDNNRTTRADFFTMNFKLQYFFRYRDHKQERLIDYRDVLKKGTWFIGGRMVLREFEQLRLINIQNIQPQAGFFLRRNWALGTSFLYKATMQYQRMTLGINPFTRYYLNVGRKKKIFLDAQFGYDLLLSRSNKEKYNKSNKVTYGGAIGWSNFITKEVSFDIAYSYKQHFQYTAKFAQQELNYSESGFTVTLQYFFH